MFRKRPKSKEERKLGYSLIIKGYDLLESKWAPLRHIGKKLVRLGWRSVGFRDLADYVDWYNSI